MSYPDATFDPAKTMCDNCGQMGADVHAHQSGSWWHRHALCPGTVPPKCATCNDKRVIATAIGNCPDCAGGERPVSGVPEQGLRDAASQTLRRLDEIVLSYSGYSGWDFYGICKQEAEALRAALERPRPALPASQLAALLDDVMRSLRQADTTPENIARGLLDRLSELDLTMGKQQPPVRAGASGRMSSGDVVSQLEAVIAGIEARTEHDADCLGEQVVKCDECDCDRPARVRSEIARTVERMVNAAASQAASDEDCDMAWAAAFRATQEQETQT